MLCVFFMFKCCFLIMIVDSWFDVRKLQPCSFISERRLLLRGISCFHSRGFSPLLTLIKNISVSILPADWSLWGAAEKGCERGRLKLLSWPICHITKPKTHLLMNFLFLFLNFSLIKLYYSLVISNINSSASGLCLAVILDATLCPGTSPVPSQLVLTDIVPLSVLSWQS